MQKRKAHGKTMHFVHLTMIILSLSLQLLNYLYTMRIPLFSYLNYVLTVLTKLCKRILI